MGFIVFQFQASLIGMINRNRNSIRWKDSHSKAIYRLRKRYRTLGKEIFDIINIVL